MISRGQRRVLEGGAVSCHEPMRRLQSVLADFVLGATEDEFNRKDSHDDATLFVVGEPGISSCERWPRTGRGAERSLGSYRQTHLRFRGFQGRIPGRDPLAQGRLGLHGPGGFARYQRRKGHRAVRPGDGTARGAGARLPAGAAGTVQAAAHRRLHMVTGRHEAPDFHQQQTRVAPEHPGGLLGAPLLTCARTICTCRSSRRWKSRS